MPEPTTYEYDALGALRTVWLPDGRRLDYLVDGRGRRVGKKVNGTLTQQWVYGQSLGPIAELDGTGAIKMRFVYASRSNVPDLVKTYPDGKLYRVYADQLGSPRVLYDIATSTSKSIAWDEFGIRQGTPSGLELPFGFAGGLYDPDTGLTRFVGRQELVQPLNHLVFVLALPVLEIRLAYGFPDERSRAPVIGQ